MFRILALLVVVPALVFFSACQNDGSSTLADSSSMDQAPADLSRIGIDPDPSWHDSYLAGSHQAFSCDNCHTTNARVDARTASNEEICYLCHADAYNSTSLLSHSKYNIGAYCNSCHYSDSFVSNIRISHTTFHSALSENCDSCHTDDSPAGHSSGGCDSCHTYPKWDDVTFAHPALASGCDSCHLEDSPANHYGNSCESCHSFPSWKGASTDHAGLTSGCENCHAGDIAEEHAVVPCASCHSYPSWDTDEDAHKDSGTDCLACHTNGKFDDDDDDDDKDDDDDDDDDKKDDDD